MQKIRINDLARELEVKSKMILDALIKVGVTEKKTHSSSIEVDEMDRLIEVAPVPNAFIGNQEIVIHPGELHGADKVVASARRVQQFLDVGAPVIPEPGVKLNAISQGA